MWWTRRDIFLIFFGQFSCMKLPMWNLPLFFFFTKMYMYEVLYVWKCHVWSIARTKPLRVEYPLSRPCVELALRTRLPNIGKVGNKSLYSFRSTLNKYQTYSKWEDHEDIAMQGLGRNKYLWVSCYDGVSITRFFLQDFLLAVQTWDKEANAIKGF